VIADRVRTADQRWCRGRSNSWMKLTFMCAGADLFGGNSRGSTQAARSRGKSQYLCCCYYYYYKRVGPIIIVP